LGSGPGTASIAFLLWADEQRKKYTVPKQFEFHWWDEQPAILEDGKKLFESHWKNITLQTHRSDWRKSIPAQNSFDFVLMGHVLNEAPTPALSTTLQKWIEKSGNGGTLIIEPALQRASQNLSQIRDQLAHLYPTHTLPWVGPCLHAGNCPLAHGRDWCHFSSPVELNGRWFRFFSRALGSERDWIKYCYLWVKSPEGKVHRPLPPASKRLVITDTLRRKNSELSMVLLCEPNRPKRVNFPSSRRVHRGDLISLDENPAGPLSRASGHRQAIHDRPRPRGPKGRK
jgi:ribosomal protein RSM22 (predicted rRNA methylase)